MTSFPGHLVTRWTWTFADQVVYSGTNFATAIVIARLLGPSPYGSFAFVFATWLVVQGVLRAILIQPFVVTSSPLPPQEWRVVCAKAVGAALYGGCAVALLVVAIALLIGLGSETGRTLFAFGVLVPAFVVQDFWRFAAFSQRHPRLALANDCAWAAIQVLLLGLVWIVGALNAPTAVLAWGGGAVAGSLLGFHQFSLGPALGREAIAWGRSVAAFGGWLGLSNVILSIGNQAVLLSVGAFDGTAAVGGFRAVITLWGPAGLLVSSAEALCLPLAARARDTEGWNGLRRIAIRYALVLGSVLSLYSACLWLLRSTLVPSVFGRQFAPYSSLVVPVLLSYTLLTWASGAGLGLIALKGSKRLASVQAVSTAVKVALTVGLASSYGALGAAWALTAAATVSLVGLWWQFGRSQPRAQFVAHRDT